MNGVGIDRFAKRLSRRDAAKGAGTGVSLAAARSRSLAGAQGSPEPTLSADGSMTPGSFLVVQTAASGSLIPNPDAGVLAGAGSSVSGGGAHYLLTLDGHPGGTVYFSDRPARVFGDMPTQRFLDGLGFTPNNPPNAALVSSPRRARMS